MIICLSKGDKELNTAGMQAGRQAGRTRIAKYGKVPSYILFIKYAIFPRHHKRRCMLCDHGKNNIQLCL